MNRTDKSQVFLNSNLDLSSTALHAVCNKVNEITTGIKRKVLEIDRQTRQFHSFVQYDLIFDNNVFFDIQAIAERWYLLAFSRRKYNVNDQFVSFVLCFPVFLNRRTEKFFDRAAIGFERDNNIQYVTERLS